MVLMVLNLGTYCTICIEFPRTLTTGCPQPTAGPYRGLHAVHDALDQPLEIVEGGAQAAGRHVLGG